LTDKKWTHKQIDRQKDGLTDYSKFNIDIKY
jgi:hypothetical protein